MRLVTALLCFATAAGALAAEEYPPVPEPGKTFIAPLATEALLLDGTAVDGRLVVVGAHGIALISDDGGANWTQAQTGTRTMLTGVHFHDRDTGWIVGHDALILRTGDGGASWEQVYFDPDDQRPLFDVWFDDDQRGIAIGAYGLFLVTEDGGANWESLELIPEPWPEAGADEDSVAEAEEEADLEESDEFAFEDDVFYDFHLNHITAASDGTLYVAAEGDNFFRSDDAGDTWFSMPTTYEGSFFNTLPLGDERLLLMGMRGNLYVSPDGGQSFTGIDLPVSVLLNDGLDLGNGHLLIGGMAGALLESRDGGTSWTLHQQSDRKAIAGLLAAGDAVVVLGEDGVKRLTIEQLREGGGT